MGSPTRLLLVEIVFLRAIGILVPAGITIAVDVACAPGIIDEAGLFALCWAASKLESTRKTHRMRMAASLRAANIGTN
jgi:hypothetical protein